MHSANYAPYAFEYMYQFLKNQGTPPNVGIYLLIPLFLIFERDAIKKEEFVLALIASFLLVH